MLDYRQLILDNLETIVLVLVGLLVLALFFFIINTVRLNQLHKRYRQLMRGVDKSNLEELIFKQMEKLKELQTKVETVQGEHSQVQKDIEKSLGPVGIVRYNAFNDVGSDLSFSIALLNREKNGFVLTSLFGREDSRIFAKPIENGDSSYKMTDEEKEAVQRAVQNLERNK
ncbi:DUF4446 family protein [Effusibacillus dendaii]|uniref:DUF4446 family protein n=1 Tax=Effusibacillus dendaii TaxID=2743772 RepID=A0A7I8DBL7_9BACL|nr:DUF4446 family protein [Effusibacillus dendaii]BCJ87485.1 hypothetical protein skT53_24700 [Effusibacillus dendaii]